MLRLFIVTFKNILYNYNLLGGENQNNLVKKTDLSQVTNTLYLYIASSKLVVIELKDVEVHIS
jgi:hypothetical protein